MGLDVIGYRLNWFIYKGLDYFLWYYFCEYNYGILDLFQIERKLYQDVVCVLIKMGLCIMFIYYEIKGKIL